MKILFATLLSLMFAGSALASDAEIEWVEPDNFTDIKPAYLDTDDNEYRENLFNRFEGYVERIAGRYLEEGNTLKIQVHDWDMAGQVLTQITERTGRERVRHIMDNEFPTMTISYQLVDADGNVHQEAEDVQLEGRAIHTEGRSDFPHVNRRDRELIGSEIKMFNRWFKENFIES